MSIERGTQRKISRSTTFLLTNEENSSVFLIADLALSSLVGSISTSPFLKYDRAITLYRLKQKTLPKKKGDILKDRFTTFQEALDLVSKQTNNFRKLIIPTILYRGAHLYTSKMVSSAWAPTYEAYDRYGTVSSLPMMTLLAMIPPLAMSTLMQVALVTKVKLANDIPEHGNTEYTGFADCVAKIDKMNGISTFFTGYHLLIASQALSSIIDTAFRLKEMTRESDGEPHLLRAVSELAKFVASYPLRLVHERVVNEAGIVDAMSARDWFEKIWREEGLKGFFAGFLENLAIEFGAGLIEKLIHFAKDKFLETSKTVPRLHNIREKRRDSQPDEETIIDNDKDE